MTLKNQNPYWTAGTLEGKAYIERDADQRLRKELSENQRFVFLFGPRHSGTSSLITHCMDSLSPGQYCCTRVDLSKLPHRDYHMMIGALLETVANDTALDKQEILTEFPEDTILAWLRTFPQRLILFLDEVQSLATLPFRDQLFGKLRFLYNVRVENEQFSRLQVVLSGASHPERLIPINLAMPFVGGGIEVPLLNQKQVEKLTWDLESAGVQIDGQVASLLYQQTSGVVHLCQIILHELWEEANRTRVNVGVADVERVIERLIPTAEKHAHFAAIYVAVTSDAQRLGAFLRLVKGDPIDPGLLQDLTQSGLCDPERPYLCPIYERVFGPGGPMDLGLARKVHTQVTSKHAIIQVPSQNTPEVHTEPPPEARRDHSLVTRLPVPPSMATPPLDALPEPPPQRPLPGMSAAASVTPVNRPERSLESLLESLPENLSESLPESLSDSPNETMPGVSPVSPEVNLEVNLEVSLEASMSAEALPALPAPPAATTPLPMSPSRITPLVQEPIEPPPIELRSAELQPVDISADMQALSEPPPPGADSSSEIIEIDQAQEEDPTWVDDPVQEMKSQLARKNTAQKSISATDKKVVEVRGKLDAKLMLSAELDSFCASFFPHVAQKFVPGMSRGEKTELLLGLVAASEISKRLREWSSRIELNQEVISAVVSRPSGGSSESGPRSTSGKSPPRKGDAPSIEEPANFKPPMNAMQVGVGLVLANRYFLTSEVGPGPVAVVWSAYDRIKDEQVALKLITGSAAEKSSVLEVFWRSAQQMAALSHPAIVGVLNKPREENEVHYIVLEFLPGGNLRQWVLGGKLSRGQILRVLQRLGAGLQYAHERRVLHRNIKPSNILFDSTGHARLTDFNLVWPGETAASAEARTDRLMYMAPEEQLGGSSGDPRADVYSLGMCALFALHGKELPSRVVQDRTSFIEHLDATPSLKAVLKRATAANPVDRFATAAELCRALEFDGPSLPGISVRNSMQVPVISRSQSSGPSEMQAALPQQSNRPAPALPVTAPGAPPPIPNAPSVSAPPPLPAAQVLSPPSPPPLPVFAPQELVVPAGPPLQVYDGRPGRRDPDSGEIPPMPGQNPKTVGEYRIETERLRAMAAAAAQHPPDATPVVSRPRPMRWQPFVFAGIALLAVAGGSIGYFIGAQKAGNPQDPGRSTVATNTTSPTGDRKVEFSRPLKVESLVPPVDNTQPAKPVEPPPAKLVDDPVVAKLTPDKNAAGKKPAMPTITPTPPVANPPPVTTMPTIPTIPTQPKDKPTEIALAPAKNPPQKPGTPPAKVTPPPTVTESKDKPTMIALAPVQKLGAKPEKVAKEVEPPPAKPTVASAPPSKPATPAKPTAPIKATQKPEKPVMIALAPKGKGKTGADTAAPPTHPKASEPPRAKVTPAKVSAPPPRVKVTPPPPPPPRQPPPVQKPTASTPTQSSTPEGEAALSAAQSAFVRGQHQQAIAMAMQVTARGGADALKAWRFVGSAACSVRSAPLATNAYNHLRDPDHRRLLSELCRRNGLTWNGSSFGNPED